MCRSREASTRPPPPRGARGDGQQSAAYEEGSVRAAIPTCRYVIAEPSGDAHVQLCSPGTQHARRSLDHGRQLWLLQADELDRWDLHQPGRRRAAEALEATTLLGRARALAGGAVDPDPALHCIERLPESARPGCGTPRPRSGRSSRARPARGRRRAEPMPEAEPPELDRALAGGPSRRAPRSAPPWARSTPSWGYQPGRPPWRQRRRRRRRE